MEYFIPEMLDHLKNKKCNSIMVLTDIQYLCYKFHMIIRLDILLSLNVLYFHRNLEQINLLFVKVVQKEFSFLDSLYI